MRGESSLICSQKNTANCGDPAAQSPGTSTACRSSVPAGPQQPLATHPEAGRPREPPAAPLPTRPAHRAPRLPRGAPASLRPPAAARTGLPLPMPLPARRQPPLPLPRPARLPPQRVGRSRPGAPSPPARLGSPAGRKRPLLPAASAGPRLRS